MAERRIRIVAGSVSAEAVLNGSATAAAVWDALPLSVPAQTWGDEIYFSIPVKAAVRASAEGKASASGSAGAEKPEEWPRETVELGDLGYWPPGSAFCIFFGRTPASRGEEIRPASPVNVFGRLVGDATVFKKVRSGTAVRVERA